MKAQRLGGGEENDNNDWIRLSANMMTADWDIYLCYQLLHFCSQVVKALALTPEIAGSIPPPTHSEVLR